MNDSTATACLLVLGGSADQMFMLRTARHMGLRIACLDGNPAAAGLAYADLSAVIDFSDLPAVFRWIDTHLAAGENLTGVSTMGSDVPHLLAAIATRYDWVGPSPDTGRWATDKLAMKERFMEMGVPVPRFAAVTTAGDVDRWWQTWGTERVIIKPTDRAGSRGVRVLNSRDDIAGAVDHAREQGRSGHLILEEFVPGPQISVETILCGDHTATPGFVDRCYEGMEAFHPQIMENGGWIPSRYADTPLGAAIENMCVAAARALGITAGVGKSDVVVCSERGPLMIELAARLSGGDFSEGLVPLGTGVNYVRTVIEIALGREPEWGLLRPALSRTVANRYFFPAVGILREIRVADGLRDREWLVKLEFSRTAGDVLPEIRSHADRAGVFIVVGATRQEVQRHIDEVYAGVEFICD